MELNLILKVLGEPTRLAILQALLERKHCVRSLSNKLGITESAVSQHLKRMRDAGLVYAEQYGYHTHYYPSTEALEFLEKEIQTMLGQSRGLDRADKDCHCAFKTGKENSHAAR